MSRFGRDPLAFFEGVYRGPAPWDIGRPQTAMAELLVEFPPRGPVLDVGCGSGDLAIHLAQLGIEALGIDFIDEAIARAKSRKALLPPEVARLVDFRVADALQPSRLGRAFGAVVDSGFYHLFEPEQCAPYVEELERVLVPGGRCYLHEFAVTFDGPNVPRAVTEAELRQRFSAKNGWQPLAIRGGEFLSTVAPVPAIVACMEYAGRT